MFTDMELGSAVPDEDFGNKLLRSWNGASKAGGCASCLHLDSTWNLTGVQFSVVFIPEILCKECVCAKSWGLTPWLKSGLKNMVRDFLEPCRQCCEPPEKRMVKVVLYEKALEAMQRFVIVQRANNDVKGIGNAITCVQQSFADLGELLKKMRAGNAAAGALLIRDQTIMDHAMDVYMRAAYIRELNPRDFRRETPILRKWRNTGHGIYDDDDEDDGTVHMCCDESLCCPTADRQASGSPPSGAIAAAQPPSTGTITTITNPAGPVVAVVPVVEPTGSVLARALLRMVYRSCAPAVACAVLVVPERRVAHRVSFASTLAVPCGFPPLGAGVGLDDCEAAAEAIADIHVVLDVEEWEIAADDSLAPTPAVLLSRAVVDGTTESDHGFGDPLVGETMPGFADGEWFKKDLDEAFEVTQRPFADLHPNDQKDKLAAESSQREIKEKKVMCGTGKHFSDGEDQAYEVLSPPVAWLREACAEARVKPQGMKLLPGNPEQPVHIAAANTENMIGAIYERHLKPCVEPTDKDKEYIKRAYKYVEDFLIEGSGGEKGIRTKCQEFFGDMTSRMPKKWTEEAKARVWTNAALFMPVVSTKCAAGGAAAVGRHVNHKRGSKGGMQPLQVYGHVKANESLNKLKARGIFEKKELGAAVHTCDAGFAEYVIFSHPWFEARSVKHATGTELADRFAKYLGPLYKDHLHLNTDFGSYDNSVRQWIRDIVENSLVDKFAKISESGHAGAAAALRGIKKVTAICGDLRVEGDNWCRMSGDRGTSVFNYITNIVLFIAAFIKLLEEDLNMTPAMVDLEVKMVLNIDIKRDRDGKIMKLVDIVGEGDDGWQFISDQLIKNWCNMKSIRMGYFHKSGYGEFVTRWVDIYASFGFKLEPQTAKGREVNEAALQASWGRSEFVSRIIVPVMRTPNKVTVRMFPKPRKALDSLCQTFCLPDANVWSCDSRVRTHALSCLKMKALCAMSNSLQCPLLFRLMRLVHDWAMREEGLELVKIGYVAEAEVETEISVEAMIAAVGYSYVDLSHTYGEDPSKYYTAILQERTSLSSDYKGEQAADAACFDELRGSGNCGFESLQNLHMHVDGFEHVSGACFIALWAAFRKLL